MNIIPDPDDLKRTMRYLKRNGLRDTFFAAAERLRMRSRNSYSYISPNRAELDAQRTETSRDSGWPAITIIMPAYNTPGGYLRDAVGSLLSQSYGNWKLVIPDASDTGKVSSLIQEMSDDPRIIYCHLDSNGGISANTNAGIDIAIASGCDYIGFLDHDDELTPDALYRMACAIREHEDYYPAALYSDEDKMSADDRSPDARVYFDAHRKYDFNYDLFMTNNYICHLMLIKSELLQSVRMRPEYDGAQDYDLVLQIIRLLCGQNEPAQGYSVRIPDLGKFIVHVPYILYHWRSHAGSTSANTASKTYAYEAGLKALSEHLKIMHGLGASHSRHLGFYSVDWTGGDNDGSDSVTDCIFRARPDIGAVIGRVTDGRGRMSECIADESGEWLYAGLNRNFAGPFNRFDCIQDVYMADIRYVKVRPELEEMLAQAADNADFARRIHEAGYMILYLPTEIRG